MIDEKEITFFTIDLNNYIDKDDVASFCINHFKEAFPDLKFKIYTPKDKIVKNCLEEFEELIDILLNVFNCPQIASDVVRIYILSKKKKHIYLDGDMFIKDFNFLKNTDEKKSLFFLGGFQMIYSGNDNKEIFGKLLDFYKMIDIESMWKQYGNLVSDGEKIDYCYNNFADHLLRKKFLLPEEGYNKNYPGPDNYSYFHFEAKLAGGKNFSGVKFLFSEKSKKDFISFSEEEKENYFSYKNKLYGGIIAKTEEFKDYKENLIPWDLMFKTVEECILFLQKSNNGAIFL